ncbi:hypothetical protein [Soonwooa sp.]|uniref:hypothetical protein n=1 Tax=Soonwooa sp. TaxID=1938592 RepID=UPI002636AAAD|nr:hypothetical protein [Soonwooa sp.]
MKKYCLLIALILLALVPQSYFGQAFSKKLENTYWKRTGYYAKSGTMNFEALPEKPTQTTNFDYFGFEKDNAFIFHIAASKACSADLIGKYKIDKSKISFTTAQTKINGDCGNLKEFKLTENSIVFRNGVLYLAKYSSWYDEAPTKKGDTIFIPQNRVGTLSTNEQGRYLIADANGIPFENGTYKIIETTDSPGKSVFSSKNGLLDHDFIDSDGKKVFYNIYKEGILFSEKRFNGNQLYFEKTMLPDVQKEASGQYRIKITEVKKNANLSQSDSIITTYTDDVPISKIRYQNNKLVADMDFGKKIFKKYNSNGKLSEIETPGQLIKYDNEGGEESKELYNSQSYELYEYGKLRTKKTYTKKDITTITYDEKGKIKDKKIDKKEDVVQTIVDDSDRYHGKLGKDEFEFFKKLAK